MNGVIFETVSLLERASSPEEINGILRKFAVEVLEGCYTLLDTDYMRSRDGEIETFITPESFLKLKNDYLNENGHY